MLNIKNLTVSANGKKILEDFELKVDAKTTVIMGKNGSGKSTLANALLKNPKYKTEGEIKFDGADISALATDATARAGIFLSQQITPAIPGLSISTLLKNAANAAREKPLTAPEFFALAKTYCELLDIPSAWLARDVGVGFSGGEKKRLSMLEMLFANPKLAILDEPDSGVDISSIDIIIKAIEYQRAKGTRFVVISHYPKLIDALKPDAVHVIEAGKIARSGGHLLAKEIEKNGF